jgi:hypothetical protein
VYQALGQANDAPISADDILLLCLKDERSAVHALLSEMQHDVEGIIAAIAG